MKMSKSSISTIWGKKEDYKKKMLQRGINPNYCRYRQCHYPLLEEALYTWLVQARLKNIPLNGLILQQKAIYYAMDMKYDEFEASKGWLNRFKARRNIIFRKICGEEKAVNPLVVEDWKEKIPSFLDKYSPSNIYNIDESGLFYKCLPDKTLTFKGDTCSGTKSVKSMEKLNIYPVVRLQRLDSKLVMMKRKAAADNNKTDSKRVKVASPPSSSTTTTTLNGCIIPPLNKRELKKHLRLLKIFEEDDDDFSFKDKLRSRKLPSNGVVELGLAATSPPQSQSETNGEENGECGAIGFRRTRASYSIYSLDKLKEDQDDIRKSHEGLKQAFDNEQLENPLDEVSYPDMRSTHSEPGIPPICDKRLNKLRWSRQISNGAVNHLISYIQQNYYSSKEGDEGENGEKKARKVMTEKTTNLLLKEEFKKQHRLMKIFQETDEEETSVKTNKSTNTKVPKEEKVVSKEPSVIKLISRMQEASWNDRIVGEFPNHFKVGMLTRVLVVLRNKENQEVFVHYGGLKVVADWLALLPSGRLPHLAVREMMLRLLHVLPQDLDKIRESSLTKMLEVLLSHPEEHRLHKRWILWLLDRWAPPSPPISMISSTETESCNSQKEEEEEQGSAVRERSRRKRHKKIIFDAQLPKWYLQLFKEKKREEPALPSA